MIRPRVTRAKPRSHHDRAVCRPDNEGGRVASSINERIKQFFSDLATDPVEPDPDVLVEGGGVEQPDPLAAEVLRHALEHEDQIA